MSDGAKRVCCFFFWSVLVRERSLGISLDLELDRSISTASSVRERRSSSPTANTRPLEIQTAPTPTMSPSLASEKVCRHHLKPFARKVIGSSYSAFWDRCVYKAPFMIDSLYDVVFRIACSLLLDLFQYTINVVNRLRDF